MGHPNGSWNVDPDNNTPDSRTLRDWQERLGFRFTASSAPLAFSCPYCHQPPGARCRNATGDLPRPHQTRTHRAKDAGLERAPTKCRCLTNGCQCRTVMKVHWQTAICTPCRQGRHIGVYQQPIRPRLHAEYLRALLREALYEGSPIECDCGRRLQPDLEEALAHERNAHGGTRRWTIPA